MPERFYVHEQSAGFTAGRRRCKGAPVLVIDRAYCHQVVASYTGFRFARSWAENKCAALNEKHGWTA